MKIKLATVAMTLATFGITIGVVATHDSQPVSASPVVAGSVSDAAWNELLARGWHGCQNDHMEALYPAGTQCATITRVEW